MSAVGIVGQGPTAMTLSTVAQLENLFNTYGVLWYQSCSTNADQDRMSEHFWASIPSFFIRVIRVVRLSPMRAAAPSAPPTRPLVSFRMRRMRSCSSKLSILADAVLRPPSVNSGTRISILGAAQHHGAFYKVF